MLFCGSGKVEIYRPQMQQMEFTLKTILTVRNALFLDEVCIKLRMYRF
jgi:hypothetical protein